MSPSPDGGHGGKGTLAAHGRWTVLLAEQDGRSQVTVRAAVCVWMSGQMRTKESKRAMCGRGNPPKGGGEMKGYRRRVVLLLGRCGPDRGKDQTDGNRHRRRGEIGMVQTVLYGRFLG